MFLFLGMFYDDNLKLIEPKQTMSTPVVDTNNKDNAAITTILGRYWMI